MVKYGGRVPIPLAMWKKIEEMIKKHEELGYRSVTEFVIDTLRRRFEDLEKENVFS